MSELLKALRDVTEPLNLIAFLAVVVFGVTGLILQAVPQIGPLLEMLRRREVRLFAEKIVSSLFWAFITLLVLGFGVQVLVIIHRADRPPPLQPIVSPVVASLVQPSGPTTGGTTSPPPPTVPPTTPPTSPPVTPRVQPPKHIYKLVWFNHYTPNNLWEVRSTNVGQASINNNAFAQWCVPFDPAGFIVVQRRQVAGDEHFKEGVNWWTAPPYNLPALNERWLQIMDDERWYFYELIPH